MSTHTQQQIKEAYAKLPEPLKEAIDSEETDNVIFALRKKLGLTIEQLGDLSEEVGAVFLGFTRASDFPREVKERLGLDQARTDEIVRTVNEQIFAKIRAHLQTRPVGNGESSVEPRVPHTTGATVPTMEQRPVTQQTPRPATPPPSPQPTPLPPILPQQTTPTPPGGATVPKSPAMPAQRPTTAPSILEQKLAAPVVIPAKETANGSGVRMGSVVDPYREPME